MHQLLKLSKNTKQAKKRSVKLILTIANTSSMTAMINRMTRPVVSMFLGNFMFYKAFIR